MSETLQFADGWYQAVVVLLWAFTWSVSSVDCGSRGHLCLELCVGLRDGWFNLEWLCFVGSLCSVALMSSCLGYLGSSSCSCCCTVPERELGRVAVLAGVLQLLQRPQLWLLRHPGRPKSIQKGRSKARTPRPTFICDWIFPLVGDI